MPYPADHMYIATYGVLPVIIDPLQPEGDTHKVLYQKSYPDPDPDIDGTMFYGWEIHALNMFGQLDTDYSGDCTISMDGGGRFILPDNSVVTSVTAAFVSGVVTFGMGYSWKYLPKADDVDTLAVTYTVRFSGLGADVLSAPFKFVQNKCYTDLSVRKCEGSDALTEIDIDISGYNVKEYQVCVSPMDDKSYAACAKWPVISTALIEIISIPSFLVYTGSKSFCFDYKGGALLNNFTFAVKPELLADKTFNVKEAVKSAGQGNFKVTSNSKFPGKGIYDAKDIKINFSYEEPKAKTTAAPPKLGSPMILEDITRLGEKYKWTGQAANGAGVDLYNPAIKSNSPDPISSTFSSAGAFYYPLDLDDSPTIYYLPKQHCSIHGSLTKPYNVLASRSFENPKILAKFLSPECIAVYEKLDIMLCAPNRYECMNNRPEQLIGSTEGRDKINCEWPITGDIGIHSYVASIAPVIIRNYESGYDREICSFPCEGFFPACASPSVDENNQNDQIEMTHVKIPCTLARSTNPSTGESVLTVAVSITNFGFSPQVQEDSQWWVDGTLYSYVFGLLDPITGKRTTFCPYTSRTREAMLDVSLFPNPTSFGHSYIAYNGRNVSYGVLRSDKFSFQTASPDIYSYSYAPISDYTWKLNTHFNLHFCSVQKTSKEPVPSYTYFQIPAAYADTRLTYDPNNLMEHDADKVGDNGYMFNHGRCIEYPKGYTKKIRSKDLNNLEKGCIQLEEGYWNGREYHGRFQYYCVVPMIEPAGCAHIKADGAPGSGVSKLSTSNIATIDEIVKYAKDIKETKVSGMRRIKEELSDKTSQYNKFVKPEDFQGGRYFYFHMKCHPYAGVDYMKLTQKLDGSNNPIKDNYDWGVDMTSVALDLALLEKYASRYNTVSYHHFPSDPDSGKDHAEINSSTSASSLQRTNCLAMKQSSKNLPNVFFNCYNTTFENTPMASSKKSLADFILHEFSDPQTDTPDVAGGYKE